MARDMREVREVEVRREEAPTIQAPMQTVHTVPRVQSAPLVTPRDRVRWGPVLAGLITALSVFLLLQLLMYGLGLLTLSFDPNAPTSPANTGAWITAVMGLLSLFFGGWIAGATSLARGGGPGLLSGCLGWALMVVLVLVLSSQGLGLAFGAFGGAYAQLLYFGRGINIDPNQAAAVLRNASLWAFVSLVIGALAAGLGGWLGGRGRPIGYLSE